MPTTPTAVTTTPSTTASTTSPVLSAAPVIISYFLHSYAEKVSVDGDEATACLFEFPFYLKKSESNEIITKYIRSQLEKANRCISDKCIQLVLKNGFLSQSLLDTYNSGVASPGGASMSPPATPDTQQISFLYLNLLVREVITANGLNNDLKRMFSDEEFPRDLEAIIKFKIG